MTRSRLILYFSIPLLLFSILLGCARSFNPNIERGSSFNFRNGYPEVRFTAIGLLNQNDQAQINIAADVVFGSLIYREENDSLMAQYTIEIQVLDKDNPSNIIDTESYPKTIITADRSIIYSQDIFTFERTIPVSPGNYEVRFSLKDETSGKRTDRSTTTYIPNPENNVTNLTAIMMMGKRMSDENPEWFPITTYDVTSRVDSLKFRFQATNNNTEAPLTVEARLVRFRSDSSIARPMHYNNYSSSNIQYKGIDYDRETVIQSTRRRLLQPGSVLIEFKFEAQPRGNYRFEVRSSKSTSEEEMFRARDFGVKSKNYPAIQTPRELARPLAYLMSEKEHEELMAIENPDSLKQAIDAFWLRNVGDVNRTKNVIKMYYERVEEANKQFSNFKEGWKTDTGMVYILFGPPWYVEQHLDEMVWSYSYNHTNPQYNYLFRQSKLKSEYYPFTNYLLQRSQYLYNIQYQQIQLWLTGQILNRSI